MASPTPSPAPRSQTFSDQLQRLQRGDATRPLLTFYDHDSGERTELSVTTYANWVAKAAGLLVDEVEAEPGEQIAIELPAHWLGPVFVGAALAVGLTLGDADEADIVITGPEQLSSWAERADSVRVLACSLLPMGVRFAEPVPVGVLDVGVEIWAQPDSFAGVLPPSGDDLAVDADAAGPYAGMTQRALMQSAAAGLMSEDGGRLLSVANPASPPDLATFLEPFVRGGSLVLIAHLDPDRLDATVTAERVTDVQLSN